MKDLYRLLLYARPHFVALLLGIVLTSVVGFFEAARIALVEPIFNGLAGRVELSFSGLFSSVLPQNQNSWAAISGLLVLFTILRGGAFFLSGYLLTSVGQSIIVKLRQQLYDHILKQSATFFARHRSADLTTHIISDVERVQHAVTVLLADTLREAFTLLALLVYAFSLNWKLAAFSLFVVPPVYALTLQFGKRLRRTSHKTQEGIQEVLGTAQEGIIGNRIVKAFGMEQFESKRLNDALHRLQKTNMRTAAALYLSSPILELVGFLLLAALILFAQTLISSGNLSIGSFTALLAALFKLYDPMRKLSQTQNNYQQIFAASSRVFALLDEHTEIVDRPNAIVMKPFTDQIELKHVTFSYPDTDRFAVKNIDLKIAKGEVVALVGKSGSGKTTLTNLLLRFFEPSSGEILIDNHDIRDIKLSSLRSQISLVSQEIMLFNDTIRNNIAYGRADISQQDVENAARAAHAHDFILSRGGYDVVVGENGLQLSGGQRQRIAVARAMLKNAPILILDEATSNLDTESEMYFQQALTNLMQDRTTIVIAHRLSTVRRASRIVVLDQGQIVETGTHEELLDKDGIYKKLYELQFATE
ncbi:MAG: ATP-binding cassette domain-containing protein, partial [Blastocatellia bacterium]|nr:ATP-binding cassette domain-containing protein [Blastocatellia bacterium]